MALQGHQLGQDKLCCFICNNLMKDPVIIACGHSYCMSCINIHWDGEEQKNIYSCPQCIWPFEQKPFLVKNAILAELVEEEKKKTELQAGPSDHCYAGPGDVGCDICSPPGQKRKALKSCRECQFSFCEHHLQPHYEVPYNKHLLENICSQHDKVMEFCSMDEHKGHDTVSAAAEISKKQKELGVSRQNIQLIIQKKEKDVELLQQEVEAINLSADKAVREKESMITELVNVIKRSSDVKLKIIFQQKYEVSRVKEIQETLQKEISDLRRKDTELEKLSKTDDLIKFLQANASLSNLMESEKPFRLNTYHVQYFDYVTAAVLEARGKVLESFDKESKKISKRVTEVVVRLLPDSETKAKCS